MILFCEKLIDGKKKCVRLEIQDLKTVNFIKKSIIYTDYKIKKTIPQKGDFK